MRQILVEWISNAGVAVGSIHAVSTEWLRISAPVILAGLAGGAVSLIVVREQVSQIDAEQKIIAQRIGTGILPIAEERISSVKLELLQLRHQHELFGDRLNALEQSGPIYCLRCHMTKGTFDHPKVPQTKR